MLWLDLEDKEWVMSRRTLALSQMLHLISWRTFSCIDSGDLTDTNDLLELELFDRVVCQAQTNRPHRTQDLYRQFLLATKAF